LYISSTISMLEVTKLLIYNRHMHNLYTIFVKILEINKRFAVKIVDERGNIPRRGAVPRFSDLEVISLNLAAESIGIDSEKYLFSKLKEYKKKIPNLISRRQYNDRRKITSILCNNLRKKIASYRVEDLYCIDSKPIEVCRPVRAKCCKMSIFNYEKATNIVYCVSQRRYYYGYKLHAVCRLSGVIYSFDMTKAGVHDINYLQDVKYEYHDCSIFVDRGYIGANVQLDLFETAHIKMEVPYRLNQKDWKPTFIPFAKARKRIETVFSQLCDQFMIIRNYTKQTEGFFTRIISKISALTILQ